jgi:hypothetical protein
VKWSVDDDGVIATYMLGPEGVLALRYASRARGYPAELAAFEQAFGDADIAVSDFVAGPRAHVDLIDLEERVRRCSSPAVSSGRPARPSARLIPGR